MKIIIAKGSGFCFGVKRAAEFALRAAHEGSLETLGELIHNPEYLSYLSKKGVRSVSEPAQIKGKRVLIRAHGISKKTEEGIKKRGIEVIDATCPFVKRVQRLAEKFEKEGYAVLLLGEPTHPEVQGITGYAPKLKVIQSASDLAGLDQGARVAFISQTTQSEGKFMEIADFLKKNFPKAVIENTICNTTHLNQEEARKLSREVDIMIVIGGRKSSNTTRLREICEENVTTKHIENENDLQKSWFAGVENVGVTAGASTPDFSIKKVLKKIKANT